MVRSYSHSQRSRWARMLCGANTCGSTTATIPVARSGFFKYHKLRGTLSWHLGLASWQIFSATDSSYVTSFLVAHPKADQWPNRTAVSMLLNLGLAMAYHRFSDTDIPCLLWY